MRVLAIDTAVEASSLALGEIAADGGVSVLGHICEPMARGHAERLFPLFEKLKSGTGGWDAPGPVDRIVVTRGPGTFTGARVGLAAARGFALAWGVPVIGVSTVEALALSIPGDGETVRAGIIDARRGELYIGLLDGDGVALGAPFACAVPQVWSEIAARLEGPFTIRAAGSGAGLLGEGVPEGVSYHVSDIAVPDVRALLPLGRLDPAEHPADPLYLRAPDAKPQAKPAWAAAPDA